ncbi:MAG: DUF397 domain-containing protein [Actinocatenispora sp.]
MTTTITNWRKSSRSGAQANCVEVGTTDTLVGVRDSKDQAGPALAVAPTAWSAFVAEIRTGDLSE